MIEEMTLTIGEAAERAGVATSALRFYERAGLIASVRTSGGQRRYSRDVLRRLAFIGAAKRVGLGLDEIRQAMSRLPDGRTPNPADWARLSKAWSRRLDDEIAYLQRLRDDLSDCIGCGCLSFRSCALYNPADRAGRLGAGPRYLLGDRPQAGSDGGGTPRRALDPQGDRHREQGLQTGR